MVKYRASKPIGDRRWWWNRAKSFSDLLGAWIKNCWLELVEPIIQDNLLSIELPISQ